MATTVIQVQGGARPAQPWNASLCDCCAPPTGCGTCCYAFFCTPCAAGDVAESAGGSYCVSCCLPILLGAVIGVPTGACCWCTDRVGLIQRYNIADSQDPCANFCTMAFCAPCAIAQELNMIQAQALKGSQMAGQTIVVTQPGMQVMAPAPMAMGAGAAVYPNAHPAYYGGGAPQGQPMMAHPGYAMQPALGTYAPQQQQPQAYAPGYAPQQMAGYAPQ